MRYLTHIAWAVTLTMGAGSCSAHSDRPDESGRQFATSCDTVIVADTTLPGVTNAGMNSVALTSWARARGAPTFEAYAVPAAFTGKAALPRFATATGSRRFKTVLTAATEAGPNFAGHYTVAMWGCGSPCVSLAIIDAITGQIVFVSNPSARAPMFRRDSRLLVFDGTGFLTDSLGRPKFDTNVTYTEWLDGQLRTILTLDAKDVRLLPSAYGVVSGHLPLRTISGPASDLACWEP
jgi:hypothetical protein